MSPHSFGTYCVSEVLRDNPHIKPKRIIFCGSIVASNFRWDSLSQMRDGQMKVINECGSKDIWPPLAHSTTIGYGDSGVTGFQSPGVQDRCHNVGHSGYFDKPFVERYWIPFMRSGDVVRSEYEESMKEVPWWMMALGVRPIVPWLGWVLIAVLAYGGWRVYASSHGMNQLSHLNSVERPPARAIPIAEVPFLADPNYAAFEIKTYEVLVDIRDWQPLGKTTATKSSAVKATRRIVGIKLQPVDEIRLYASTEGSGIDFRCLSGQPARIEHSAGTGTPEVNLMHKYHLVVDISSVAQGSRFEIIAETITWNGLKETDPWHAFVAFAPIGEMRVQLLFPVNRPYKTRKFVKYPNRQKEEVLAEGEGDQLERPEHDQIFWGLKKAVANTTYEIQWTW